MKHLAFVTKVKIPFQNIIEQLTRNFHAGWNGRTSIIGYTPNDRAAEDVMLKALKHLRDGDPDQTSPHNVTLRGFDSEGDMEAFHSLFLQSQYGSESSNLTIYNQFIAGIVFNGLSQNVNPNQKISYKIRLTNGYFYNTNDLMPPDFDNGPGYSTYTYFYSTFSAFQLVLDKTLIETLSGKQPDYKISIQAFPYPPYESTDIDDLYYIFLPQFIVLGFVFVIPLVVNGVVSEKETGIKELMKMSGLPEYLHWLGWMLNSLLILIITVTIIVVVLFVEFSSETGAVFQHSDPTLMWVVLMIYAVWATTYCFSISAFFERPTLATTCGILVWLVSFNALGFAMEESYGKDFSVGVRLLMCIFPNVAIHLALKAICIFEASEKGAKWGNIAEPLSSVDSLTLLYVILMFLASICLNMVICLYAEAIMPKKYGVRKPFYFFFQPSYWGIGRNKNNISHVNDDGPNKPGFEEGPSGLKAGVEIRKLRKEFGKSKVAVNDISMKIYEGQIFCLLGQNGLFAPTSGTALINGYDIRTDMESIRQNLGLCPQHNMLFDKLTWYGSGSQKSDLGFTFANPRGQNFGSDDSFYGRGAGYTLSMSIVHGSDENVILGTVRRHIEDAHFKSSHSNNASEISIVLPSESNTASKFPKMFAELTERQEELGIKEVGVGWTTMDEVFVRVEELSHATTESNSLDSTSVTESSRLGSQDEILSSGTKLSGLRLLLSQFIGLFMKKLFYSLRKKRLIVSQMIIPVLLTIASVVISSLMFSTSSRLPPLTVSISPYKNAITLYSSTNETIGSMYAGVVGSSAKQIDPRFNNNVSQALLEVGISDISIFRDKHIIAAEINDTHMKAMYSTIATHSSPLSMNLLTNTLLRGAAPGQGNWIETINHPFRNSFYDLFQPAEENPEFIVIISFIFGVMVPIGLILLAASFIIAPTEERLCQGKQLQMMSGVNPLLYWVSAFICDYFLMLVSICLMTACLPIFEKNKAFTNNGGAGTIFLIMAVYGLASIFFGYIFSTFARSVAGGFTFLTIVHLLTGVGLGVGSNILEDISPDGTIYKVINVIGRIFPTYGMTRGAMQYAKISSGNSRCFALTQEAKDILCSPTFVTENYYRISQECCENCADLGDGECFETTPFFQWSRDVEVDDGWFGTKIVAIPALTQDVVWLVFAAVLYFAILMLVEYDAFKLIFEKFTKEKKSYFQTTVTDNDVIEENQRVHSLVNGNEASKDAILVDNLCKAYGTFSAVSGLSFGVHHGECFGLLGVNGAGKTTTFRMLTGDETRSNGNAYMNTLSLVSGRKEFLSNIGYCPQFDGIIGVLTGKEMLCLFARLRGVSGDQVEIEAKKWLRRTGLFESGDVQCQKYSGGMKRRLSAGMACVGTQKYYCSMSPLLELIRWPAGHFGKLYLLLRTLVKLLSLLHTECEALCSRVGIMVNSEMQCVGNVQHLRNKFAQGFSLTLKLKDACLQNPAVVNDISNSVCSTFQPCTLKDYHQVTMKFQIHSQSNKWEDLYKTMEMIKDQYQEFIEEYAITQTTLEEVFLSFATKQYVNERATNANGNILNRLCSLC
ncbi:ATP-binding cassette sub-family A member 3 [Orchesella cincta]|uniref:ATP-binding cassette sub-family A member 3 n=1 Tax=Orchesella cincta TaxID=48709 RepID=A0A1D2MGT4_ORCCI|nr:ATP-binding cassette sub-family A member 3 [Orchesella cincta]